MFLVVDGTTNVVYVFSVDGLFSVLILPSL